MRVWNLYLFHIILWLNPGEGDQGSEIDCMAAWGPRVEERGECCGLGAYVSGLSESAQTSMRDDQTLLARMTHALVSESLRQAKFGHHTRGWQISSGARLADLNAYV